MKIVQTSGNARTIGRSTGEELREEIAQHIELFPPILDREAWEARLPAFMGTLKRQLPQMLEEMEGTAEGANQPLDNILGLNLPMYNNELDTYEGCTNVAFADGPDGPVWGKNNDKPPAEASRPFCGRLVTRDDGIPSLIFTFCGLLATTDGMNAEGLAMGHSSVGSIFQQSDHHVPIRLWAYECMMYSRSTAEFIRELSSLPTRGKGYSILCVDASGSMASIEAPCPLLQVRAPEDGARYMNCVNYYQLPELERADRRTVAGKLSGVWRRQFLDKAPGELAALDVAGMEALLRHHGAPSVCAHGDREMAQTEYSMIGIPRSRKVLYCDGNPCESEYAEITL